MGSSFDHVKYWAAMMHPRSEQTGSFSHFQHSIHHQVLSSPPLKYSTNLSISLLFLFQNITIMFLHGLHVHISTSIM